MKKNMKIYQENKEKIEDYLFIITVLIFVISTIPKERPSPFSVFASRITRNLALKKYEYLSAEKRKPEAICSFEELGDCVSGKEYVESEAENRRIEQLIDTFLCQIGEEKRNIFLCRYWYLLWFLLPLSYF